MTRSIDMRGFKVICHLGSYSCLNVSWDEEETISFGDYEQPYNVSVVVLDKDDRLYIFKENAKWLKFVKE